MAQDQRVKLFYRAAYLVGFKPWDTGITPPELVEAVEGPDALPAGNALDLGCGTGTNAVYLTRHGWDVTAIDMVGSAIRAARRRAAAAGVTPRLLQGDVTRLDELGVGDGCTLVFDLGCFHSIPAARRDDYAAGVTRAAAPGATFLLFGFLPGGQNWTAGVTEDELRERFRGWEVVDVTLGTGRFRAAWYRLRRTEAAPR
jgi:SAM-dependent methyltransferase